MLWTSAALPGLLFQHGFPLLPASLPCVLPPLHSTLSAYQLLYHSRATGLRGPLWVYQFHHTTPSSSLHPLFLASIILEPIPGPEHPPWASSPLVLVHLPLPSPSYPILFALSHFLPRHLCICARATCICNFFPPLPTMLLPHHLWFEDLAHLGSQFSPPSGGSLEAY